MIRKIICMLTLAAAFVGCTKDEWPDQPDWSRIPDPSIPVDDGFMKPAACSNTVVAHRGGAAECGAPDNSMAALEYAMSLGCYGMECDIYWTKDNDIIVAHANGDCKVNNLQPWTATVAELRAAGRLSNGEELPTLEEFIRRVMVEGNCTRLVLDVKRVDKPYAQPEYVINAALKEFTRAVAGDLEHRCGECYAMRLEHTAQFAAQHGFDSFTTTLLVSPYQNHELLRQTAEEAGRHWGVTFLYRDFRPGFRDGQQQARELGFYMQKYCGCVFSEDK